MKLIKFNAIDSTNNHLKKLSEKEALKDYTTVMANHQSKGKGQMGNSWVSESGKNALFSTYKRLGVLQPSSQFYISMAVSIAIFNTLKKYQLPLLSVKWPNDILSDHKKICGILIENIISRGTLKGCIIGIGININQKFFDSNLKATSLFNLTGKITEPQQIIMEFIEELKPLLKNIHHQQEFPKLKAIYHNVLYRINKPSTFKITHTNNSLIGIIKGVSDSGKLILILEDNQIQEYDIKEIKLLN